MPVLSLIWGNQWLRLAAAVAVTAIFMFPAGVVKGWNWSRADQLAQKVENLEKAAEQKEKISEADRKRAEDAEAELARSDATLESLLHETKMAGCVMSPAELDILRRVAGRH